MRHIAIDLGGRESQICVREADGTVVEERRADGVPSGVILEAVRPGFRSGRGLVLARAAVTVSGE